MRGRCRTWMIHASAFSCPNPAHETYRERREAFYQWVETGDFSTIASFVKGSKRPGPYNPTGFTKVQRSDVNAGLVREALLLSSGSIEAAKAGVLLGIDAFHGSLLWRVLPIHRHGTRSKRKDGLPVSILFQNQLTRGVPDLRTFGFPNMYAPVAASGPRLHLGGG